MSDQTVGSYLCVMYVEVRDGVFAVLSFDLGVGVSQKKPGFQIRPTFPLRKTLPRHHAPPVVGCWVHHSQFTQVITRNGVLYDVPHQRHLCEEAARRCSNGSVVPLPPLSPACGGSAARSIPPVLLAPSLSILLVHSASRRSAPPRLASTSLAVPCRSTPHSSTLGRSPLLHTHTHTHTHTLTHTHTPPPGTGVLRRFRWRLSPQRQSSV
jgi:hypothetical protein